MGRRAVANLEIDAFRLKGDPEVLNVRAVKKFLEDIQRGNDAAYTVVVKSTKWHLPDDAPPDWLETVNYPGSELIDEELRVSGTLEARFQNLDPVELSFQSHHSHSEYLGNKKPHTIVIQFDPGRDDNLYRFAHYGQLLVVVAALVNARCGISIRKTSAYVTAITI